LGLQAIILSSAPVRAIRC